MKPFEISLGMSGGMDAEGEAIFPMDWMVGKSGAPAYHHWNQFLPPEKQFNKHGYDFGKWFAFVVEQAPHVHFSLDGMDLTEIRTGKWPTFMEWDYSNSELGYILRRPELVAKTTFYKDHRPVSRRFIQRLLQDLSASV